MEALDPACVDADVVLGPVLAELVAAGRQLADEVGEVAVIRVVAGGRAQQPDHVARNPSLLSASDVLGSGWFGAVAADAGPGKPLDTPRLEAFWARLEELDVPAFAHPSDGAFVSSMGGRRLARRRPAPRAQRADRVLNGSDNPCWNPMGALEATRSLRLSPEVERDVLEGNARRLLGLPGTPNPERGDEISVRH
jgi:hypothetical protein